MKKFVSILLILIFVFSLSSCGADFDLSEMGAHDAIEALHNITSRYDINEGKIIRLKGEYVYATSNTGNATKHLILIRETSHDHMAMIEFVLEEAPDAYPQLNAEITITGALSKYDLNGESYYQLINAKLKIN